MKKFKADYEDEIKVLVYENKKRVMQLKMDCELNNIDNSATQGFTKEKISLEESKMELELINESSQKLFTLENLNNDLQRTEIMGNLETFKQRCEELELEIQ